MADLTQPYDELAAHYDQIFENWEVSIVGQAEVLGGILHGECADNRPIRVLDCACGIGTQIARPRAERFLCNGLRRELSGHPASALRSLEAGAEHSILGSKHGGTERSPRFEL